MSKIYQLNWLYPFALYVGLQVETVGILTALIVLDTITGIFKSHRINGGRSIKSKILAVGITSKFLLLLIPVTLALAMKSIGTEADSLVTMSFAVLSLSEAYSVIGNIYAYRTGEEVPEYDALHIILKKIRNILDRFIAK